MTGANTRPRAIIVDYGVGNRGSIRNMVRAAGGIGVVSSDPEAILAADRLILPGVGAFDACMQKLNADGLVDVLREAALERGIPLLGLCVGMQMLFDGSDEGVLPGLGWISGRVRHLSTLQPVKGTKIPNMGWSYVTITGNDPVFQGQPPATRFYFAHSYFCDPELRESVQARIEFGEREVSVAVRQDNLLGIQFHPERSHRFGLQLIRAFMAN